MTNFNERLARLADAVRALPDGEETARALMRLAGDMDAYLDRQRGARYDHGIELFQKWNEFMNTALEDRRLYCEGRLSVVQRNLARAVASDPRWQGGYADALALLTEAPPAGA